MRPIVPVVVAAFMSLAGSALAQQDQSSSAKRDEDSKTAQSQAPAAGQAQNQAPKSKKIRIVRQRPTDQAAPDQTAQKKTGAASDRPTKSTRPSKVAKGKPVGHEGARAIKRRIPIIVKPAGPDSK